MGRTRCFLRNRDGALIWEGDTKNNHFNVTVTGWQEAQRMVQKLREGSRPQAETLEEGVGVKNLGGKEVASGQCYDHKAEGGW